MSVDGKSILFSETLSAKSRSLAFESEGGTPGTVSEIEMEGETNRQRQRQRQRQREGRIDRERKKERERDG